ncbi:MAG: c-type cytochrome domain-containing protein, partial [Opitutales bacterium]
MRPASLSLLLVATGLAAADTKLDFNRDIRPILSDNCFACHGFDAKKRKADLRLDTAEGATAIHDGVQAVKPGDPEASELIKRILSKDPEEVMPPPESHKQITPAQVDLLRRWIAEGAVYRKHWSFEVPVRPEVPAAAKGTSPIDAFLHAELSAQGLQPAPEADKARLLRRVTLDLTGLPPTPAEVEA